MHLGFKKRREKGEEYWIIESFVEKHFAFCFEEKWEERGRWLLNNLLLMKEPL